MSPSPVVRGRSSRSRPLVTFALAIGVALLSMLASATPCFAAITLADTPRFIAQELEEWVRMPRAKRDVAAEDTAFAVALAPGDQHSYLLRLASASVPLPIAIVGELSPIATFFEKRARGIPAWGGFYVSLGAVAFCATIVLTVLRHRRRQLASATVLISLSTCGVAIVGFLAFDTLLEHPSLVGAVMIAVLVVLRVIQEVRATRSELEASRREVSALADELRDQLVQRSRDLSRVIDFEPPSVVVSAPDFGSILDGRYRVLRPLGAGGMGTVYEVERTRDDRRFALKVVPSARNSRSATRFTREVEIGARLRHPNLVPIVDVGVRDRRTAFLVMELALGGSLEDSRARFGEIPWALDMLRNIAAGLHALHAAGIMHRDLKPSNVLIDDGVARICDFGIAKHAHDEGDAAKAGDARSLRSRVTANGALVGTPRYMAPEAQAKAKVTPAGDVFAFGLIAFELLTGEYPLALFATADESSDAIVPAPTLAYVANLAPTFRSTFEACLAMDPASRPTASELDALLSGSSLAAITSAA